MTTKHIKSREEIDQLSDEIANMVDGYYGDVINEPLSVLADQAARVPELVDTLKGLLSRCERMIEGSRDCGDPDAECPMQDAGKDYHLSGDMKRAQKALKQTEKG